MRLCVLAGDTAVDLGSRSVRVQVRGGVTAMPSAIAVCERSGSTVAVGAEALAMTGRTPHRARICWPIQGGVPTDREPARHLLRRLLRDAHGRGYVVGPRTIVAVPSGLHAVHRRAVTDTVYAAGARQVALVPIPLAAAVGAGLDVGGPRAVMVVQIGALLTDVAVMALGGIICAQTAEVGGEAFDRAIAARVRSGHGVLLAPSAAEQLKIDIGGVRPRGRRRTRRMLVSGSDVCSGLPRPAVVSAAEVDHAITGPVGRVVAAVRSALSRCPAEVARDLANGGLLLSGGGARLHGLDAVLRAETGMRCELAGNATDAVVTGAAKCLEGMRLRTWGRWQPPDQRIGFLPTAWQV